MAYQTFASKCELDHRYLSFLLGLKSRAVAVQIGLDHFLGGKGNEECFTGGP